MLNRAASIVRPARPFIEWALDLDDTGLAPQPEDEATVYLVPGYADANEREMILDAVHAEVFERELAAWHTVERDWPENRTFSMFKSWFEVELHSVVEDLCVGPLVDEDD